MKSVKTEQFNKAFKNLPAVIQIKARKNYQLWKANSNHPSLHFKEVNLQSSIYSVRVWLQYRALGVKKDKVMIWFWIGSHEDYNKLISQF